MNRIETHNHLTNATAAGDAAEKLPKTEGRAVDVSVVVPLFNEADSLVELARKICKALEDTRFEILFVDDGSRDGSWPIVCLLSGEDPQRVRGVRHRRNFGKAEALATGFRNAKGNAVVTIDADLQDDPTEIPALLAKLVDGYDVVSGWKKSRQDPLSKTVPSRLFNFAARAVSGVKLHDFNCGLKAYRREALEDLKLYGEQHRFIPILLGAEGYRVSEVPVRHHPREHGASKYGWKRFIKGSLDLVAVILLTRYLKRPGHFFGGAGIAIGCLGTGILAYLSIAKLFLGQSIEARPLFFLGILCVLFAGQLVTTGIIGEFYLRHHARAMSDNRVSRRTE